MLESYIWFDWSELTLQHEQWGSDSLLLNTNSDLAWDNTVNFCKRCPQSLEKNYSIFYDHTEANGTKTENQKK